MANWPSANVLAKWSGVRIVVARTGSVGRRSRRVAALQGQGLWAHLQRLHGNPVCLPEETGKAAGQRPMPARGNQYSADGGDAGHPSPPAFSGWHRGLVGSEQRNPTVLGGLVEGDETYFLRSLKEPRTGLPRPAKKRGMPAAQRGLNPSRYTQVPVTRPVTPAEWLRHP